MSNENKSKIYVLIMFQTKIIQGAAGLLMLVLPTIFLVVLVHMAPLRRCPYYIFHAFISFIIISFISVWEYTVTHMLLCFSFIRQHGFAINIALLLQVFQIHSMIKSLFCLVK